MSNRRKAFHFDLDIEKLKAVYPSENPTGYKSAWGKIHSFMEANGFVHTQYSGYESVDVVSYIDAFAVIDELQAEFPWFAECARAATITEIGRQHDVLAHLLEKDHRDGEPHKSQMKENVVSLASEARAVKAASRALSEADSLMPPKSRTER